MIIQCPSCSTKFSVDSNQLRDYDAPRFHCSRCDHFFESSLPKDEQEADSRKPEPQLSQPAKELTQPVTSMFRSNQGPRQLDLLPSDDPSHFPKGEGDEGAASHKIDLETLHNIAIDWPDAITDRVLEADLRDIPRARVVAGPESMPERIAPPLGENPPISWPAMDFPRTFASAEPLDLPNLDDLPIPSRIALAANDSPYRAVYESSASRPSPVPPPPFTEPSRSKEQRVVPPAVRPRHERTTLFQTRVFLTPIFIALAIPLLTALWIWKFSGELDQRGGSLVRLVLNTSGAGAQLPPGLELVELRSEIVTLADGDQVLQITGNLFNGSDQTFKNIELETYTFNRDNREVGRMTAPANNGLVTTSSLSALQDDALLALQERPGIIGHEIRPNEHFPFRIIVTEGVKEAEFFSTRIRHVELVDSLAS